MIAPVLPGPRKVVSLVTSPAAGALVAQTWQAAASFVLQVVAAHVLGASGLGLIALCLGVVVLTTAVTSGFGLDGGGVSSLSSARMRRPTSARAVSACSALMRPRPRSRSISASWSR